MDGNQMFIEYDNIDTDIYDVEQIENENGDWIGIFVINKNNPSDKITYIVPDEFDSYIDILNTLSSDTTEE